MDGKERAGLYKCLDRRAREATFLLRPVAEIYQRSEISAFLAGRQNYLYRCAADILDAREPEANGLAFRRKIYVAPVHIWLQHANTQPRALLEAGSQLIGLLH